MLSLAVTLPPDFKNKTKGLLGNYDGDPNNDFKYPNGTVLKGNSTERTLFNYGISWAINDSNSVFMYPNGKSHADFDHRNFTPKFFDEATNEQISAASLLCGSNTECKYDFIMTNSELVAENTKFVQAVAENGTREVANQIPSLRFQTMPNVSADRQIRLNISAIDDGPVTFQFDINTVGAEFVYKDSTRAELNFTLGVDNQCELSITAKDNQGYFAPSIRYEYTYCDGCSSHGKCDLNTDQSETCSVKRLKCICEPYWEGTSCQHDLDGCRGSPCSLNRSCTDVNATYHNIYGIAFRCSKCPQGYLEDGNKCLDIDECNKTTNKCDQRCINTEGSFICECEDGFALSTDKRTCEDIDECERDLDNCNQNCTNNVGNFTCSCFPGFEFDISLTACVLSAVPDTCNRPTINCTLTAGCTVRNGTASCFCGKGFQLSNEGTQCLDIDECSSNPCTHICNNFDGGFTCRCYQGYELGNDRRTCSECRYPKYGNYCQETCDCGTHGVQCHPVKGCRCDLGWEGEKCQQDIDECTKTPKACGDPYSQCKNIPGHYTCQCVAGFKKSNTGDCQDIDECSDSSLNKCSQSCTNTLGNFTCGCNKGYQLDQKDRYACFDIDECSIGNAGCEQICENVPGQYNCYCHYGYKLATNRRTCVQETDVCGRIASNISCSQICLVQNGKAICACQQGYVLDTDNKTCKDVNECEWNKTCSQKDKCINLIGSFLCSCDDGYRLDNDGVTCRECDAFHFGKDCNITCNCGVGAVRCDKVSGCTCKPGWKDSTCNIDIDECVLNTSLCPGVNTKCINTPGSYLCTCQNGYKRKSNTSVDCTDINECDDPVLNTCDQNCTNNNGSYSCACNKGFIWQDTRCVDINECEPRNPCHHVCYNLQGGYRCLCYTGFKTDVDNATQCKPITECPQNETDFCKRKGAQCAIVKGNTACKCGNGLEWSNENETCIDVKDCTPSARCNQICIENIGGYTCACSEGYRLLQNNMTCVPCVNNTYSNGCTETCQCVPNNAVNETQTCNHINGTCICKTGWEGKCDRDIDECTRTPQICRGIRNSGCHNTIGGYECSCLRGYVRQNNQCIPDTFPTTTLPPQVDETFAAMSVKLDVPLVTGVNLNVTSTYEYYSYEANIALVQFYRRWLNDKLKRITIRSLTSGSLVIDYIIYIFDHPNVGVDLTLANVDLASGASIIFQNKSVKVLDLKVAGRLVPTNLSDEELCTFFQLSYRTCNSGYNCKVTNKVPTCSKIAPDDYYLTTILAVSISLALLMIGVIVVGICVFKRRASNGPRARGNASRTFSDRTMTTERDVNKQNTSSTVKTNVPTGTSSTGDKDDQSTVSSWHSSAAELCQNEEFRIKRPKLDSRPIQI